MSANEEEQEQLELRLDHQVLANLLATGVPEEVAKAFVCMRFHPQCPWGLGKIKVADMDTFAVVRPADDTMQQVECVMVFTRDTMPLSDMRGLEQIPDKSQLN